MKVTRRTGSLVIVLVIFAAIVLGTALAAIAIDKNLTKQIWRERQIPTPKGMLVSLDSDLHYVMQELGRDLVVKPAREGSSIGLTKLKDATIEELHAAIEKAAVLEKALDAAQTALDMPGDGTGNTAADFTAFVLERL